MCCRIGEIGQSIEMASQRHDVLVRNMSEKGEDLCAEVVVR